jgi:hypothetical protein
MLLLPTHVHAAQITVAQVLLLPIFSLMMCCSNSTRS